MSGVGIDYKVDELPEILRKEGIERVEVQWERIDGKLRVVRIIPLGVKE